MKLPEGFRRKPAASAWGASERTFSWKGAATLFLAAGAAQAAFVLDDFTSDNLNSAWTFRDADNNAGTGANSLTSNADQLTLTGRGADLWGATNEYVAVYRSDITGNFDVSVKLASISSTGLNPIAGLIVADDITSLGAGGYCALKYHKDVNVMKFECDVSGTVGQLNSSTASATVSSAPVWLRLVKNGLAFSAYYKTALASPWTQVGSATTPQSGAVNSHIALFGTSTDAGATQTSVFDDFEANNNYSAWNYSSRIAFNTTSGTGGANVASNITNFPMLVRLDANNFIFSQAKSDGSDIRFEDPDGTMLDFEIERWDATSKKAEIWVKVPQVDGNSNLDFITMYWGNNSATARSSGNAVFQTTDSFDAAWHLGSDLNGSATNAWNLTNSGAASTTGVIGNAYDFNNNASAATGSAMDPASDGTISFWMRAEDFVTTDRIMGGDNNLEFRLTSNGTLAPDMFTSGPPTSTVTLGAWTHVAATWNSSTTLVQLYLNGSLANSGDVTIGDPGTDIFTLGTRTGTTDYYDGQLDEVIVHSAVRSGDWIKLAYETQKASATCLTYENTGLSTWTYSTKVYINTTTGGANVPGDVTNFPLLVRLHNGNFNFVQAQSTGADLRFADSAGTLLPYEIERFDATNKLADIWVLIPTVKGNNSHQWFKMYWGKSSATSLSSGSDVFQTPNNYRAVWHLNGAFSDATANANNAQDSGSAAGTGVIANGRTLNGSTQFISVPNHVSLNFTDYITVSAWFYCTDWGSTTSNRRILQKGTVDSSQFAIRDKTGADSLQWDLGPGGAASPLLSIPPPSINTWHLMHATYDGSFKRIYVDGVLHNSIAATGAIPTNTDRLNIGRKPGSGTAGNYFPGTLDEIRIQNTARSGDWIRLEYENQKSGSAVVTVGNRSQDFARSLRLNFNTSASGANVSGNVTDIPILVRLTSSNFDFSATSATGTDIQFIDKDGSYLYHEVVEWDKGNQTGKVWVKVPQVDGNTTTDFITLYYGCSTCTGSPYAVKDSVWKDYRSVFHLNAPEDKAYDAGSFANHGTFNKNQPIVSGLTTKSALFFDGASDYITVPDESDYDVFSTNVTVSAWLKVTSWPSAYASVVAKGDESFRIMRDDATNNIVWALNTGGSARTRKSTTNVNDGNWHYIVGTYDGSNLKIFVNGAQESGNLALSAAMNANDDAVWIGSQADNSGRLWNGAISEVRIASSTNVQSANYIKLSYENQKENSLLFTNITTASFQKSKTYKLNTTSTGADVSGDVWDFPLLLRITAPNGGILDEVAMSGSTPQDIRFTGTDGVTWLDYHVERWDQAKDSAEVWVRIPKISGNSRSEHVTLWYKKTAAATVPDGQCATCVFPASTFRAVWKMNDSAATSAVTDLKGSYNAVMRTSFNTASNTSGHAAAGIIGRSVSLDGTGDHIAIGQDTDILQNVRQAGLSAWINPTALDGANGRWPLTVSRNGHKTQYRFSTRINASGYMLAGGRSATESSLQEVTSSTTQLSAGASNWYHFGATIDYSTNTIKTYVNGVEQATSGSVSFSQTTTANTPSDSAIIGANGRGTADFWSGRLDEMQLMTFAPDAHWMKLAYMNQRRDSPLFNPSPDDFNYSRKYTFNTTKTGANVMSDVTDFPMLIRVTDANGGAVDQVRMSGSTPQDIRFLDGDGKTWLNYQVERWSQAKDSAEVWVLVPRVDGNSSTDHITLYYGEKTANSVSDAQCATCVFPTSTYQAVWTMEDNAASTTVTDILGQYNGARAGDGTSDHTSGHGGPGYIGARSMSFNGTSHRINLGNDSPISQNLGKISFMSWFQPSTMAGNDRNIIGITRGNSTTLARFALRTTSSKTLKGSARSLDADGLQQFTSTDTLSNGTWYHGAFTVDYAASTMKVYVNGSEWVSATNATFGGSATTDLPGQRNALGARGDGGLEYWGGYIDNSLLTKTVLTADWVKLSYETQRRTGNVFWNSRPGPNNRATLTASPGTGAISLSWTLPVSDSSNADSVGLWVRYDRIPDSANANLTTFVVKLPKTDSTYSYPATYPGTYYFGLAVRNSSGQWSPIPAGSGDTVVQGGYATTDTVYVDSASGDNTRSCATASNPSTPKRSIANAVANCTATDTLVVRVFPGTYTDSSLTINNKPTQIVSFDGNSRATLNGNSSVTENSATFNYTIALNSSIALRRMDVKCANANNSGVYIRHNATNVAVDGCRIYNGSASHQTGIRIASTGNTNILVANSAIVSPTTYGILMDNSQLTNIVHNVFVGPGGSSKGIYYNKSATGTTYTIANNVFFNWDYGLHTTDSDNDIGLVSNNLFHLVTSGNEVQGESDAAKIVKDPLFAFTTANAPHAFKLLPGSPGLDAGTASVASGGYSLTTPSDAFGTSRPQGSARDIGLYEGTGYSTSPTVEFDTLTVTAGTDTIAVKNGKWKVVFDKAKGGGIARFYDMVSDSTSNLLANNTLLLDANIDGTAASAQTAFAPLLFEKTKTMALIRQRLGVNTAWDLNVYYTLYASGHIFIQSELVNLSGASLNLGTVSYTAKVATAASAFSSNQGKTGVSHKNGFGYLLSTRDVLLTVGKDLDAGASAAETWTQTAASGAGGNVVFSTSDLSPIARDMLRQHHFLLYVGDKDLPHGKALAQNADTYIPAAPVMAAGSLLHERSWQDNLIAHWTMDDGGGDTAKDKAVNYQHNALVSGAKFVSGKVKGALRFTNADVAVVADQAIHEARTDGAILFWVKPNWTSMDNTANILTKGTSATNGWHFRRVTGENKIRFTMGSASVTTPVLAETTWTHIAAVFRGPVQLYVDGVMVDASSASVTAAANANAVRMGENSGSPNRFVGHLDDVRLYSTHINGHEVQAIAARGFKHRYGYYHLRADNNNRVVALLDEGAGGMRIQPAFRIDNWWAGATPKFVYLNGVQLKPNVDFVSSFTTYPPDLGKYLRIQVNRIFSGPATLFIDDDDSTGYLGDAAKMKSLVMTYDAAGKLLKVRNFADTVFGAVGSRQWELQIHLAGSTATTDGDGGLYSWKSSEISPNLALSSATDITGAGQHTLDFMRLDNSGATEYTSGAHYTTPANITYTILDSSSTRLKVKVDAVQINEGTPDVTLERTFTIYPTGKVFVSHKWTALSGNASGTQVLLTGFEGMGASTTTLGWAASTGKAGKIAGGQESAFHGLGLAMLSVKPGSGGTVMGGSTVSATNHSATQLGMTLNGYYTTANVGAGGVYTNYLVDISRDWNDSAGLDTALSSEMTSSQLLTARTGTLVTNDAMDFNGDGFAEGEGAFVFQASDGGIAHFQLNATVPRVNPVFKITGWTFGTLPEYVILDNQQQVYQYHYNAYLSGHNLILQFNKTLSGNPRNIYISHKTGLAVTLNSLAAVGDKGGNAIHWTTESEFQNLGYHIWRRQVPMPADTAGPLSDTADTAALAGREFSAEELAAGGFVRINFKIIPGAPDGRSSSRRTYSFLDREAHVGAAYEYYVQAVDFDGQSKFYGPVTASPENDLETALYGNYPNPFNPVTFIRFSLREELAVALVIFDLRGRVVKTLLRPDKPLKPGRYRVTWDATNNLGQVMATGPYFYRFQAGRYVKTKKMILLK